MEQQAMVIQNVITTLQTLEMPCTYTNMNKLLGCIQALSNARDAIMKFSKDAEPEITFEPSNEEPSEEVTGE